MKKNDKILIAVGLIIALIAIVVFLLFRKDGSKVLVTVDGVEYLTFDLNEDITHKIELANGRYNTLVIKDGYVDMVDASCPDRICVDHRNIHYTNESITCLPNRVVFTIVGGVENEVDFIVR